MEEVDFREIDATERRRAKWRLRAQRRRALNPEKHRAEVRAYKAVNAGKVKEKNRSYSSSARGLAKKREQYRRWRARTAETRAAEWAVNCEKIKAYVAAHSDERAASALARRDHQREIQRAWRAANPGYMQTWKQKNPDKVRADRRGRKIHRRQRLVAGLMTAQRGRCAYCRGKITADTVHVDHIQPRARGASNKRCNLQLTCEPCNLGKGARDPIDHARTMGFLL